MKIAIVGAGAMGSLFAWQFAEGGAEVWVHDVWQEHVDAIRANGLQVSFQGRLLVADVKATSNARDIGPCDAVLVFVKYNQTSAALEAIASAVSPSTLIVTLQNGLGNVEIIQAAFPENRIAYGLTSLTSELRGPGQIEASYNGPGKSYLWPLGGEVRARERELCDLLNAGEWSASIDPEIDLRIWKKLVINCCFNTLCSIFDCTVGETVRNEHTRKIFSDLISEICAVAVAKGIRLSIEEATDYLYKVGEEASEHIPSMAMDIRQGRQTEIECLNGAVARECENHGIKAPINGNICNIVRALEIKGARQPAA